MDNAIEVKDLYKAFGETKAVEGVSFNVEKGEIFSLLGPNGAGKTTTLSMLACLLRPDEGDALVMGHSIRTDPMGVKSTLGVVPQEIALYEDLSAQENLSFWGKMYGLRGAALQKRVAEVLEVIGLTERAKDAVGKYSGGMKRRVNIGVALLHKPQVIYMDEPTVGIDPQSRRNILDSVVALKQQGMTVLYTTHYMEEAQELSDHIGIMDHGKMIAGGTNAELVKIVGATDRITVKVNAKSARLVEAWQAVPGVKRVSGEASPEPSRGASPEPGRGASPEPGRGNGTLTILADDSNRVLPHLFETAAGLGVRITSVAIQEPNLEAVFLHLTGRALRD